MLAITKAGSTIKWIHVYISKLNKYNGGELTLCLNKYFIYIILRLDTFIHYRLSEYTDNNVEIYQTLIGVIDCKYKISKLNEYNDDELTLCLNKYFIYIILRLDTFTHYRLSEYILKDTCECVQKYINRLNKLITLLKRYLNVYRKKLLNNFIVLRLFYIISVQNRSINKQINFSMCMNALVALIGLIICQLMTIDLNMIWDIRRKFISAYDLGLAYDHTIHLRHIAPLFTNVKKDTVSNFIKFLIIHTAYPVKIEHMNIQKMCDENNYIDFILNLIVIGKGRFVNKDDIILCKEIIKWKPDTIGEKILSIKFHLNYDEINVYENYNIGVYSNIIDFLSVLNYDDFKHKIYEYVIDD